MFIKMVEMGGKTLTIHRVQDVEGTKAKPGILLLIQ